MDITLNLIRDVLAPFGASFELCDSRPVSFRMLCWLPQEGLSEPEQGLLYVLADSVGFDCVDCLDEGHYLLMQDAPEARDFRCNVILVDPRADFVAVCNALNHRIRGLIEWELAIERALLKGCDIQGLLDLSEHMLCNPALIMSKSLRLVAYTKGIPLENEVLEQTVERGYFPDELIQYLIKKDHLSTIEGMRETGITYPEENFVKCPIITRAFGPNPLNINTISVYCLNSEPTAGEVDLVDYIGGLIFRLASAENKPAQSSNRKAEYLLLDLLTGTTDEVEISAKAELSRIPFEGALCLYCLRIEQGADTLANYLLTVLQSQYHVCAALRHEGFLVFLDNDGLRGETGRLEFTGWLEDFLADNRAVCGSSRVFDRLSGAAAAFEQAKAALMLGTRLHPGKRLYRYMDYYVYDLMSSSNRGLESMCVYLDKLEKIKERDIKRGSDNLELLHALLRNERNITSVSKEMHLHRNSVVYRMERIEEYLDMKLDDPVERLALELSIRAFHLMRTEPDAD